MTVFAYSFPPVLLIVALAVRAVSEVQESASRVFIIALVMVSAAAAAAVTGPDRTTLPIPEPKYPHSTVLDVRIATPPPRFEVKAPAGAEVSPVRTGREPRGTVR